MRPFFDLIASSQGNQQWEAMGLDTLADALAAFIFESAHLADRVDGDPREPSPEEMKEKDKEKREQRKEARRVASASTPLDSGDTSPSLRDTDAEAFAADDDEVGEGSSSWRPELDSFRLFVLVFAYRAFRHLSTPLPMVLCSPS